MVWLGAFTGYCTRRPFLGESFQVPGQGIELQLLAIQGPGWSECLQVHSQAHILPSSESPSLWAVGRGLDHYWELNHFSPDVNKPLRQEQLINVFSPPDWPARAGGGVKEGSKPSPDWMVGWKIVAIIAAGCRSILTCSKTPLPGFKCLYHSRGISLCGQGAVP